MLPSGSSASFVLVVIDCREAWGKAVTYPGGRGKGGGKGIPAGGANPGGGMNPGGGGGSLWAIRIVSALRGVRADKNDEELLTQAFQPSEPARALERQVRVQSLVRSQCLVRVPSTSYEQPTEISLLPESTLLERNEVSWVLDVDHLGERLQILRLDVSSKLPNRQLGLLPYRKSRHRKIPFLEVHSRFYYERTTCQLGASGYSDVKKGERTCLYQLCVLGLNGPRDLLPC